MRSMINSLILLWLACAGTVAVAQTLQGTAFTYQGQLLQSNLPVTGSEKMVFTLWNDPTLSGAGNQVGPTLSFDGIGADPPPVSVVDGIFAVTLDFGGPAFITTTNDATWLQVSVNGTVLSPRTQVQNSPYALTSQLAYNVLANSIGTAQIIPAQVQQRVTGVCASGSISAIAQNGTVTCQSAGSGTVTSITAGTGLTGGTITTSGTIAVDTTVVQARVTGTCASGSSISTVNVDGTVACQSAGTPFTLPYSATLNSASTLFSLDNTGSGQAITGLSTGTTAIYGATGTVSGAGLLGDNLSGGEAVTGRTTSASGTPTGSVVGRNDGPGYGVYGFIATDTSGNGIGVLGRTGISGSKGVAGHFENVNSSNASTALEAVTNGTGSGATVANTNNANTSNILNVTTNGPGVIADHSQGNAGNFFINNTNGVGAGVRGETNSIFGNNGTAGVYGVGSGTGGYGGYFEHSNSSGFGLALFATTAGLGVAANITTTNASNAQPTLEVSTNGTGSGATIANTNNTNTSNVLNVTTNGPGVIADHSQGNAGNFFANNTTAVAAGVRGEVNSIFGNAGTAGVYGVASGTGGYAGYFEHTETTGFGISVEIVTNDQGTAMVVDHEGSSGDLAIFQTGGFNMARIDRTGRGFFDGGTQTGGADLAELVATSGSAPQPGDVVEIDTDRPDSFRVSGTALSTRVAGVISTKPGVTMNADDSATKDAQGPALALAGRVPVKVSDEGGPIHIGDLLVSASLPGHAMRAPTNPPVGTVIGKAMQELLGPQGTITMLVWMH